MGVWIEIRRQGSRRFLDLVTPFMGVWIEIEIYTALREYTGSHTLYGCVD